MSNEAKIRLGFQLEADDFAAESASIYTRVTTFISTQPEGSTREYGSRAIDDGYYVHVVLKIVVTDIDDAKAKRNTVYNAITAEDAEGNPRFPPLMDGEKGWHFVYEEDGLPVEIP